MDSVKENETSPEATTKSRGSSPRATSPPILHESSSSSSLLLPENKKDSPTKRSRMIRSASSGSLARKSPPAAQDAASILESLSSAEQEILNNNKPTHISSPVAVETKLVSPKESPKKAVKIPASTRDSPRTPEGEKRAPRPSLVDLEVVANDDASMEKLRQSSTSPLSEDTVEEETSPQTKSNVDKSASPKSPLTRDASLQWTDVPRSSSRVIRPPEPAVPLPSEPSMRLSSPANDEVVAVFNANTKEGKSIVRALAKSGSHVVAIVRVFTSRNTKSLLKLGKNVVVKVADTHDEAALAKAVEGAHRAFLVTTYWDRFDSSLEEKQAFLVLNACASQHVCHLVLTSFEDTKALKEKGLKSQIVPRRDGTITPTFEGMKALKEAAREQNVQLTHMITSYLDQEHSKKSLCLIVGENGNLIVQSHTPEEDS